MGDYYCYCLYNNINNKTYIGSTNNKIRRLRQHNKEISGGAKYTTSQQVTWTYLFYITCPEFDQRTALSFEWHLKHPTSSPKIRGPIGRIHAFFDTRDHPKFAHIPEYNISIRENFNQFLERSNEKLVVTLLTN